MMVALMVDKWAQMTAALMVELSVVQMAVM